MTFSWLSALHLPSEYNVHPSFLKVHFSAGQTWPYYNVYMSDADNPNPVSAVRPRRQPDSRDMTLTSRDDHTNYHDDLLNNGFPDRAQGCQGSSRLEGSVLLVRTLCSLQSIYVSTRILNFVFTFPGRRSPFVFMPWLADAVGILGCRLLIPLNVCRKDKLYLPWECENERHAYEK